MKTFEEWLRDHPDTFKDIVESIQADARRSAMMEAAEIAQKSLFENGRNAEGRWAKQAILAAIEPEKEKE